MEVTQQNFDAEVLKSDKPVLVDFWAEWCGPCKAISPIVEELEKQYEGKIKIGKINVDQQGPLSMQYGVMSIPTLALFKNGKIVDQIVGAVPKTQLESMITKHI
jgi:thioredoxin 1